MALRVERVNISAIARVEGIAWNTAARWLEKAASVCCAFNRSWTVGFVVRELQADELRAFVGSKTQPAWIFVAIEVSSRLWPATVTGRRSYRNTRALLGNLASHIDLDSVPLIVTNGFGFYEQVVRRVFGPAVLYGQVLKTQRNNRVVRVERRVKIGTTSRLKDALLASEDSATLNTSFVERLNLTMRQGSAYLRRRSPCHARGTDQLRGHVELLRCFYNFIRPHRALKFGRETRTPAMQAGLVSAPMNWSDIFTAPAPLYVILVAVAAFPIPSGSWKLAQPRCQRSRSSTNTDRLPDQQRMAQAPPVSSVHPTRGGDAAGYRPAGTR